MIPTLLLLGLVIGALGRQSGTRRLASVALLSMALVFGIGIGISEGTFSAFFGGTALAFVNLLVGTIITASVGKAWRRLAA